jgi:UDP-N-acetyl-D-glucosamine dehydrogenase
MVDPHIKDFKGENGEKFMTVELTDRMLQDADLVVITTDHSAFDEKMILKNSKIVYDTRNFIKQDSDKVVRL